MKRNRRKHTKEFKEDAVKLITEQGYSIAEAARSLGLNSNMLGKWKRDMESENVGDTAALRAENRRLEKENKRLKMEREILKKPRPSLPGKRNEISVY
jgi:transposase